MYTVLNDHWLNSTRVSKISKKQFNDYLHIAAKSDKDNISIHKELEIHLLGSTPACCISSAMDFSSSSILVPISSILPTILSDICANFCCCEGIIYSSLRRHKSNTIWSSSVCTKMTRS